MTRKIIFILPDLTTGGAEMVVTRLMNALPREKYAPEFITVRSRGTLRDFIDPAIPFHELNSHVYICLPILFKTLKKLKPDIVITTMAHMNFATLILRPFFPQTKFIVRESTLPACTLQGRGILKPVIRKLYSVLYPRADRIIAPARIILEKMTAELGLSAKTMAVLPNPVEIRPTAPYVPAEKIRFIAAGRLHYEKGFDRLIDALKDYRGAPWHLTIIGEGSQRVYLENLITVNNLAGYVSLPGFSREPWKDFAASDCFLLPSRWEGSPNAALESLAAGTPVIALREAGGIVEIASETLGGTVTIADDMEEFLRAMMAVRVHYDKKSLLPPKYDRAAVIRNFETLLQEILP